MTPRRESGSVEKTQLGHRVGRPLYHDRIVCVHPHGDLRLHIYLNVVCEETQRAHSVVVGCSPPRVERWGMLVHQGGGWLIDRARFSTRPAEPRHSFHPEPANPLGRARSPAWYQPKD